uniref:Uncharacterized protein n=1 Tax=Cyclocybe aegerita TaxID=1973307 RepID=A0A884P6G3_CYCAE|nr:hypothetical protein K4014_mgp38 [Cyclocybe aegerita]QQP21438.1 hypothetical protein [Cyclocybe aegerita]
MFLLEILKFYGINLYDPSIPPFVLLCLCFLNLFIFSLGCFCNIIIYFTIIINKENKYVTQIRELQWLLGRLINLYIKSSYVFLVVEILLFFWINIIINLICFKIVNTYYKIF